MTVKTETVFVDATRSVSETEGRISIYLWVDVPRNSDGAVAPGQPVRLWVELEWERKSGGAESLKLYEEPVPPEWLAQAAYERRLKARVKDLFAEAKEAMFERGCSGTMAWGRDWMLSGRPARNPDG